MRKPIFLALLLATASPALAQPVPTPSAPIAATSTLLTFTSEGQVRRAPDLALFTAGVVVSAETAAEAMAANSRRVNQVIMALRRAGVAERDIQTSAISLQPRYADPEREDATAGGTGQPRVPPVRPGGQRIVGYEARNSVQVRTRRLAEMGRLIDALISAGANEVSGPGFTMEDPGEAMDRARLDAIANGRARAELYARAAGLRVGRIVSINEADSYRPVPFAAAARAEMADSASTPVAPGELTLSATVTMQFELTR